MKHQHKVALTRFAALLATIVLVLAVAVLPAFAMGMGSPRVGASHHRKGFVGRTADSIESGIEGITDDIVDIPNAMTDDTDLRDGATETNVIDGLLGDEALEDGTNIPDSDIGGAVKDNDKDGLSNPVDSDDDGDGVPDPADSDADGNGLADTNESTGVIGIVIAVIIVIAIIVLVIAVVPRPKKQ